MALVIVKDDENSPGRRIEIADDEVVIGWLPECSVVLNHQGVSLKHAMIRRVGREYFLIDLGSTNRTFLNSYAIPTGASRLLHDGDRIRICTVEMIFHQMATEGDSPDDRVPIDDDRVAIGVDVRGMTGLIVRTYEDPIPYVPTYAERRYPLWFGTNRRPIDSTDPPSVFTSEDHQILHYGTCSVKVPKSHKIGSTGSRWWRRLLTGRDDRLKLVQLKRLAGEAFWASVRTALAKRHVGSRDAVVFIHGFNVSFEEAALRAAQIGFDLDVRGIMAFYSWPSKGSPLPHHYTADEATIEASEPFLAEFLTRFAEDSTAERVHVIAHSMGNRGLLRSMQRIATQASRLEWPPFGHLVLAAPDIDTRVFRDLARVYVMMAGRTTLYASSKDRALASSGIVHDHPRAGYTPPLTVIPAIDTVEVSNIDLTFLGHGYFAEARDLLHDLHDLLINDLPPEQRMGLRATVATSGERSWVIQA